MIDIILYTITLYAKPLVVVCISVLIIGLLLYILSRNFDIHKKRARYLGLLTGLGQKQIIQLSAVLIKTILMVYATIDFQKDLKAIMIMILTAATVYIILTPRKLIFETINTIAQEIVIFFIHYIHNYRIDVSSGNFILQVEIALIVFLNLYVFYFFLENVETIIRPRKKKGKRNEER